MNTIAKLALEDGTVYAGKSIGFPGEHVGEVVFNTSMEGYQEILTDPSYRGQIVTMTYPHIGNYGVNDDDVESDRPQVEGFVVRELSKIYSNLYANRSLGEYLKENKVVAIEDIDTRALTKRIRSVGAMRAVISTTDLDDTSLVEKARNAPHMAGRDLVSETTTKHSYTWDTGLAEKFCVEPFYPVDKRFSVVVIDYGVKRNILRLLVEVGFDVMVVSAFMSAEEVLAMNPDAIFLSNGPGDPAAIPYAVETIKILMGKKPIFGICLGHQLMGLAFGAKTFKLKFGHRGANQPVMNLKTKKVEITSQNHGFSIEDTLPPGNSIEITHINLNDNTIEGIRHKTMPAFSVQYHPEASPGPNDSHYLFREFYEMVRDFSS